MSTDEEMLARGRLVTAFSDANRRYGTLLGETSRIGKLYSELGNTLKNLASLYGRSREVTLDAETEAVIDVAKIRALLKDLHQTHESLEQLRSQIEPLGLR